MPSSQAVSKTCYDLSTHSASDNGQLPTILTNRLPANRQHSRTTACALMSDHGYFLIQAIFQRCNCTLGDWV